MTRALTVFIIDDDEDDKEMFCEIVTEINTANICITASNGQEALQMLKNQNVAPDFIFVDLNMPRMNGKQFLTQFKILQSLSSIPVIIYSTSKLESDKEETKELGASYFLTKPSSMQKLRSELEFVFAKRYELPALTNQKA
jgi:CheY-like chemotaxis protein